MTASVCSRRDFCSEIAVQLLVVTGEGADQKGFRRPYRATVSLGPLPSATTMSIVLLARDLNLSISTVSRALNGYTDVAPGTRERVAARAKQIGYRANPGARRLKTGKTHAVGVVLPAASSAGQFVDSMYSSLLGGVATELEAKDYHLLVTLHTRHDDVRETALHENFIRGGWVDALLIVRTRIHDPRIALARQAKIPFVTYGRTESAEPYAWIDPDNEKAFHLLATRQLDFGHRRIALLNGPREYFFAHLRQRGFERAFAEKGAPLDPALILHGDVTEAGGHALGRSLLVRHPAPTSLVCATDAMAVGAIAACREQGLAVGTDISVTGYGNTSASAFCDPPLTTVEHQAFENGRHLGNALLRLLRSEAKPSDIHYLEPVVLVPRKSDGDAVKP